MKKTIIYTSDYVYLATCNKTNKQLTIRAKNEKTALEIAEETFLHLDFNLKQL